MLLSTAFNTAPMMRRVLLFVLAASSPALVVSSHMTPSFAHGLGEDSLRTSIVDDHARRLHSSIGNTAPETCSDNPTFTFALTVGGPSNNVCTFINTDPLREVWCNPVTDIRREVRENCAATCEICTCRDDPFFTFIDETTEPINPPALVTCEDFFNHPTLTQGERSSRIANFCNIDQTLNHDIPKYCRASCGSCSIEPPNVYCEGDDYHPFPPNPVGQQAGGNQFPLVEVTLKRTIYKSNDDHKKCYIDYFMDNQGYPAAINRNNKLEYLDANENGNAGGFLSTGLIVGEDNPSTSLISVGLNHGKMLKKNAIEIFKAIKEQENNSRFLKDSNQKVGIEQKKIQQKNHSLSRQTQRTTTPTLLKNLVIPFVFSGDQTPGTTINHIKEKYAGVKTYFNTNSGGQLTVESTVFDEWVVLNDDRLTAQFCAGVVIGSNSRKREQLWECLRDALATVQRSFDDTNQAFSDFDEDEDGVVDSITFIHSGVDEESGDPNPNPVLVPSVWSHVGKMNQSWNSNGNDGRSVSVGQYQIMARTSIRTVATYGIGLLLGLEELYDADGDGSGLGNFDLMSGPWGWQNARGDAPPLLSAYSKWKLGWTTNVAPTTVISDEIKQYELRPACNFDDVLKIDEGFPAGQYLLIENRQSCGPDVGIPNPQGLNDVGGLAIYHIDEGRTGNDAFIQGYPGQTNWPANNKHYRISMLQADGKYELERDPVTARGNRGDGGDLFRAGRINSIGPDGLAGGEMEYPNTNAFPSTRRRLAVHETGITIRDIGAIGGQDNDMRLTVDSGVDRRSGGKVRSPKGKGKSPTPSPRSSTSNTATTPISSVEELQGNDSVPSHAQQKNTLPKVLLGLGLFGLGIAMFTRYHRNHRNNEEGYVNQPKVQQAFPVILDYTSPKKISTKDYEMVVNDEENFDDDNNQGFFGTCDVFSMFGKK